MNGGSFRPPGDDAIAVLGADGAAHARRLDCFEDEVVVDFPSVAAAVEKMRSAFVDADRRLPLRARVRLTPQQASDGITLPLDVPVRSTCRTCGGRGETWSEPCGPCGGSGTQLARHHVQVTVPAGVEDGACFRFAVGTKQDPPTRIELQVVIHAAP